MSEGETTLTMTSGVPYQRGDIINVSSSMSGNRDNMGPFVVLQVRSCEVTIKRAGFFRLLWWRLRWRARRVKEAFLDWLYQDDDEDGNQGGSNE